MARILPVLVGLAAAGVMIAVAVWLAVAILRGFYEGFRSLKQSTVKGLQSINARRLEHKQQQRLEYQQRQSEIEREEQQRREEAEHRVQARQI
jgi:hypothetical protein